MFDPQESDPALAGAFATADQKAERIVGNTPRDSEFITKFWNEKKRILKTEFGVSWRTPAEINPHIAYSSYGQPALTSEEREALKLLVADRMLESESISGMDRRYDGVVWVFTSENPASSRRIFEFIGHDTNWRFVRVVEMEE